MDERVLLVDDEGEFLDTLADRMRNRGSTVTTSMSAVYAIHNTEDADFVVYIVVLLVL